MLYTPGQVHPSPCTFITNVYFVHTTRLHGNHATLPYIYIFYYYCFFFTPYHEFVSSHEHRTPLYIDEFVHEEAPGREKKKRRKKNYNKYNIIIVQKHVHAHYSNNYKYIKYIKRVFQLKNSICREICNNILYHITCVTRTIVTVQVR